MKIFYREEMVADGDSYSLSPLKPRAFVAQARRRAYAKVESFEPATPAQIKLAHDPHYVDGVLAGTIANGFGNRSAAVARSLPYTVGSMIAATREACLTAREQRGLPLTCSPTSGFHHAGHAYGSGFCTFNGLLVAAMVARQEGLCDRVCIMDGDQHWGDGTQDIIDHLGLRWVWQFHGPRTNAEDYFRALDDRWGEMCRSDLVIYQAGADIHIDDPLGGILNTAQMAERDERMRLLARSRAFVWNLAGGYQLDPAGKTPDERLSPVVALHLQTQQVLCPGEIDIGDPD